jgi:hypothetical protein
MDDEATIKRLQDKYTSVVKIGDKWNTYLQIDHKGFCVVEQTTKKRAQWFARMVAIALARVESNEQGQVNGND